MSSWRNEPASEKQIQLIKEMCEFSCYPIPMFDGSTKGEASDFINKYAPLAFEDVNAKTFGY